MIIKRIYDSLKKVFYIYYFKLLFIKSKFNLTKQNHIQVAKANPIKIRLKIGRWGQFWPSMRVHIARLHRKT